MEPVSLTLAGVAGIVISEGIKFLYAEAGEVLKRWWDKRDAKTPATPEPIAIDLPQQAFEGNLREPAIHYDALAQCADDLDDAYSRLAPYVNGLRSIDPADEKFAALADRMRSGMEAVLGQSITFKGEKRDPSGTRIDARMKIDVVGGRATNVDIEGLGDVRSDVIVGSVESGGEVTGVRVRTTKR